MKRTLRGLFIAWIVFRFGLDQTGDRLGKLALGLG